MKTVILAGGLGTRISEESQQRPKPLIKIGNMPIIWHIMKIYSSHGINEFVVCLGYKGNMIREFFSNYSTITQDAIVETKNDTIYIENKNHGDSWKITLVDTGQDTMTGGRLKRIQKYVENETFCLTYGDDLKRVNVQELINFHKSQRTLATVTIFKLMQRFGEVNLINDRVLNFKEKPIDGNWVNGGYFVLEPDVLDYIADDSTVWEKEPLERLAREGQLSAYRYMGPYQPMDTMQDKNQLQELWNTGKAYWKIW